MKSEHLPYSDRSSISKSPLDPREESQEKHLLFPDKKNRRKKVSTLRDLENPSWDIRFPVQIQTQSGESSSDLRK